MTTLVKNEINTGVYKYPYIYIYIYIYMQEKGMATHSSSILAWRIPWTEKPGGLHSMGLQRVGHN